MFIANWVHRDISTGNIIVMIDGDVVQGKLSDLEYAKEFGSTSGSADSETVCHVDALCCLKWLNDAHRVRHFSWHLSCTFSSK